MRVTIAGRRWWRSICRGSLSDIFVNRRNNDSTREDDDDDQGCLLYISAILPAHCCSPLSTSRNSEGIASRSLDALVWINYNTLHCCTCTYDGTHATTSRLYLQHIYNIMYINIARAHRVTRSMYNAAFRVAFVVSFARSGI
uniref:Uncharacterized protein n=1 Tax=Trichogramma kaykai TaxID=54128 RepID=A0ABD2XDR2_9HYME